jgi:hypothetical protein
MTGSRSGVGRDTGVRRNDDKPQSGAQEIPAFAGMTTSRSLVRKRSRHPPQ